MTTKPFVHLFVRRPRCPWPFCLFCGSVKAKDRPVSACRGLVRITTRQEFLDDVVTP